MTVKEESEKAVLTVNIQKTKIVASGPITSWQIHGETIQTVTDFIFLGSKITVDSDCTHEVKRHLLHGRKTMPNIDSILRSRDITWLTKFWVVKAMVFPVVMYKCESGNIKKSELWTTDINSEYPLEVLILKLKLQYLATWCEELTHWKIPWCWERLREGGDRGRNGLMASSTQWTWVWAVVGTWRRTEKPGGLQSICQGSDTTEQLNGTELL